MKICGKCKEEKNKSDFALNRSAKDGLSYWCKKCMSEYQKKNKESVRKNKKKYADNNKEKTKQRRIENRDKIKERNKKYYEKNKEKIKEKGNTYRKENKDKIKERDKKYYEKNKEVRSQKAKAYYEKNKEKINKHVKIYYKNNKEKINLYRAINHEKRRAYNSDYWKNNKQKIYIYRKNKLRKDNNFRISKVLRDRVYHAIKAGKPGSAIKSLGCTVQFLVEYIESKFYSNMSWENYGEVWHIDHIFPLSVFDLSNKLHFYAACYYKNLQPLLKKENLSKSNKYDRENFLQYLITFEKEVFITNK